MAVLADHRRQPHLSFHALGGGGGDVLGVHLVQRQRRTGCRGRRPGCRVALGEPHHPAPRDSWSRWASGSPACRRCAPPAADRARSRRASHAPPSCAGGRRRETHGGGQSLARGGWDGGHQRGPAIRISAAGQQPRHHDHRFGFPGIVAGRPRTRAGRKPRLPRPGGRREIDRLGGVQSHDGQGGFRWRRADAHDIRSHRSHSRRRGLTPRLRRRNKGTRLRPWQRDR